MDTFVLHHEVVQLARIAFEIVARPGELGFQFGRALAEPREFGHGARIADGVGLSGHGRPVAVEPGIERGVIGTHGDRIALDPQIDMLLPGNREPGQDRGDRSRHQSAGSEPAQRHRSTRKKGEEGRRCELRARSVLIHTLRTRAPSRAQSMRGRIDQEGHSATGLSRCQRGLAEPKNGVVYPPTVGRTACPA